MGKRKKIDKFARRRLILLMVIILIIILFLIFSFKKKNNNYDDYRLIIGDEYINLKNDIFIDSFDNIYLSKQDIQDLYDSNIYYDSADNILITTFNKHIAKLELENKIVELNGSNIELDSTLIKLGDEIYLPFSEMEIVYDFEYTYSKETKTVIVDSISEEKSEASIIKKNAKIKEKIKLFSSNIEQVKKDDKLIIFEEIGNYYKVRTENGNIGYIKKSKLSDVNKIREKMDSTKIDELNFLEYTDISKDYSDMEIDTKKRNAVKIDVFTIKGAQVNLKVDTKSKDYSFYKKWTEENNIMIVANLNCEDEVIDDFLTYNQRKFIIEDIYVKMVQNNLTVLNIDFNKINDLNSYYRFLIELSPKFREAGIKVIVTNNEKLNVEKLESIVDYIIK